jgi:hypothetical protein
MNTYAGAAEIEQDIRRTRARMDSTIDALSEKLSPGELLDRVLGIVKEGGAEAGQSFARRVRANPIPLSVMAASLLWLIVSERREGAWGGEGDLRDFEPFDPDRPRAFRGRRREHAQSAYGESRVGTAGEDEGAIALYERLRRAIEAVKPQADETSEAFNNRLTNEIAKVMDLRRQASEADQSFSQRVDQAVQQLSERASGAQQAIKARAAGLARRAEHVTQDVASTVAHGARRASRYYGDHPLVVGALGVAAGALLGSLLPSTPVEERRLGGVARTARSYARRAADAAADVGRRVSDTAREAAQRQGLTPEGATPADVAERIRRAGEEAIEAGRQEAERHLKKE